jgi:hypothetical protein
MLEYEEMTVAQLKDVLRERGLPISGKKAELIARLQEADDAVEEEFTDEDDMNPSHGLSGMLTYGIQHQEACFRVTATGKILQEEFGAIAARSNHSINSLVEMANGESRGTDAFGGKPRAVMVGEAVAYRHGTPSEVVLVLCPVYLKSEFGDKFQLNPITGRLLICREVVDLLHRHGFVDDEDHAILTDDIEITSTYFQVGDLIRNKASVVRVATASQRIQRSRGLVKPSLPHGVKVRVVRVDHSDASLRWRCTENPAKSGWVAANAVEKVFWAGGVGDGDDDSDDTGFWKCFGGGC